MPVCIFDCVTSGATINTFLQTAPPGPLPSNSPGAPNMGKPHNEDYQHKQGATQDRRTTSQATRLDSVARALGTDGGSDRTGSWTSATGARSTESANATSTSAKRPRKSGARSGREHIRNTIRRSIRGCSKGCASAWVRMVSPWRSRIRCGRLLCRCSMVTPGIRTRGARADSGASDAGLWPA